MKVDSQQTQDTPNVAQAAAAQRSSPSQAQESFISLVFPPGAKLPSGPEPPGKAGAEEAANSPIATSQKLDSPYQTKKTAAESAADELQAALMAGQNSGSEGKFGSPLAELPDSVQNVAVDEVVHVQEKVSFGPHSVLPTDTDIPIVDIRTFRIDPRGTHLEVKPIAPETANPALANKLESAPASSNQVASNHVASNQFASSDSTTKEQKIDFADPVKSTPLRTPSPSVAPGEKKASPTESIVVAKNDKSEAGNLAATSSSGHHPGFQHPSGTGDQSQSRQEKPPSLANAQTMDKKSLISDVVTKFETMMAARPRDGVVVQLSPKALGTITLTLKTVGKTVDTQISASNPDVRKALSDSRPELSQAIQERGYTVAGLSVGSEGAEQKPSQQHVAENQQAIPPKVSPLEQRPQTEAIPLALSRYKAVAGVDLWI